MGPILYIHPPLTRDAQTPFWRPAIFIQTIIATIAKADYPK